METEFTHSNQNPAELPPSAEASATPTEQNNTPPPATAPPLVPASERLPSIPNRKFPYNLEAEAACIGCMLVRNDLTDDVFKHLTPNDFYDGRHAVLAESILTYRQEKGAAAFDIVVISDVLKKMNALHRAGGIPYINRLIDAVPSTSNIETYIQIVMRKALLRKVIILCEAAITQAKKDDSPESIMDALQQHTFELLTHRTSDYEHIHVISDHALDALEQGIGKGNFGIASQYRDLDKHIIGLQPANLIIIGGRTGMGKTAFALSLLLKTALPSPVAPHSYASTQTDTNIGIPTGYFSLEMSKQDIAFRILSAYGKIPLSHFKTTQSLRDQSWAEILTSINDMKKIPIFIDDTPGISMNELIAKSRRMVYQNKVGLIIVDYLQLIGGSDARVNREQQISIISKQLKNLSRELNIPVIALTQLNRAVEQRENKEPRLSDIRESGAIEQDADIVLLLHRPGLDTSSTYDDDDDNDLGKTNLYVAKNRNGPTGMVPLTFEGQFVRFVDYFK